MVIGGSSHLQIGGVADGYVPATWAGELPYNRRRRIAIVSPISLCNGSFSLCHTFGLGGDGDLLLLEKNKGRLLGVELDSPMKVRWVVVQFLFFLLYFLCRVNFGIL